MVRTITKPCVICGNEFQTMHRPGRPTVACSDICRRAKVNRDHRDYEARALSIAAERRALELLSDPAEFARLADLVSASR